jgi:hypothetical protein
LTRWRSILRIVGVLFAAKGIFAASSLLLLVGPGLVMPWWPFLFVLFSLSLLTHCLLAR